MNGKSIGNDLAAAVIVQTLIQRLNNEFIAGVNKHDLKRLNLYFMKIVGKHYRIEFKVNARGFKIFIKNLWEQQWKKSSSLYFYFSDLKAVLSY